MTYVASPAQSWIDDYFAWLNSGQCCKYDENTLQVSEEISNVGKVLVMLKQDVHLASKLCRGGRQRGL